jgi:hypothetical protein
VALDKKDDSSDTPSLVLCDDSKESTEKMLVEQAEALGIQFDHDTSVLTPEQSRPFSKEFGYILENYRSMITALL